MCGVSPPILPAVLAKFPWQSEPSEGSDQSGPELSPRGRPPQKKQASWACPYGGQMHTIRLQPLRHGDVKDSCREREKDDGEWWTPETATQAESTESGRAKDVDWGQSHSQRLMLAGKLGSYLGLGRTITSEPHCFWGSAQASIKSRDLTQNRFG